MTVGIIIWVIIFVIDIFLWVKARKLTKQALGYMEEATAHRTKASEMYKDATRRYKEATALHSLMQDTLRSDHDQLD